METRSFLFLLLFFSGMCFLPLCFPHRYILVEEQKTWAEAQRHCREKYTDLVSVNSQEESDQLIAAATNHRVWIGLSEDPWAWSWSLEDKEFYGKGETDFRFWLNSQPNYHGGVQNCVRMENKGRWNDFHCDTRSEFFCYNGKTNTSSNFVLVNERKTWKKAQRYCRKHYTDLASIRNQAENDELNKTLQSQQAWIGLYRGSWQWSDGSPYLFKNWNPDILRRIFQSSCVVLQDKKWQNHNCNDLYYFVCYIGQREQRVLRVKLTKEDSLLNIEDAADAILQQIIQKLKEHGIGTQVKLTWRKQPNGKIFTPEKEKKANTYT